MSVKAALLHGNDTQIEQVRGLDPLAADEACLALRAMNARSDVRAITAALRELLPDREALAEYTMEECIAAMRDIGIFLGSIKRHGVEPAAVAPEIIPILHQLGERTDMIPRDTVHHYCTWNPTDREGQPGVLRQDPSPLLRGNRSGRAKLPRAGRRPGSAVANR